MTSALPIKCIECKVPMGYIITHINGNDLRHFLPNIMYLECEKCFNKKRLDSKV